MHYLSWVIGDRVEEQLEPFKANGHRFVIGQTLEKLADEKGLPYEPAKILDVIRSYVGRTGKVGIVSRERFEQVCHRLHNAGIEDFLIMEEGKLVAVERLLTRDETPTDLDESTMDFIKDQSESALGFGGAIRMTSQDRASMASMEAKFDSYEIGGNWVGSLLAKPDSKGRRVYSGDDALYPTDGYDRVQIRDLDLDRMYEQAAGDLREQYELIRGIAGEGTFKPMSAFVKEAWAVAGNGAKKLNQRELSIATAQGRTEYLQQPMLVRLAAAGHKTPDLDILRYDLDDYLKHKVYPQILPMCILHKGKWESVAELGWFGLLESEPDWHAWGDYVMGLLTSSARPSDWLTAVDCHR